MSTNDEAKALLCAAREKISDPANWIKGDFAQDKDGLGIGSASPNAVCWCSLGALSAASSDFSSQVIWAASDRLIAEMGQISDFNDSHTHAEVLAAWDRAIEASA